ncbi:MAG: Pyr redox 2 protein [Patescibacteria group bacterium]|jgi:NADH dehydrogenase|nr:Pyr redox 2 protein [Patescibacteria group bacterium]
MNEENQQKVIIVGGGFAGIRCALDLAKKNLPNKKIVLISNKTYFEYYPRIYRVVTGESPLEVCIPLEEIFKNKNVEIILDEITGVDLKQNTITGSSGSTYHYNEIVLALGSETVYFNIEGVKERSYGFKSINEALNLKKHLHKVFDIYLSSKKEDVVASLHIVVVGGGPSGVELVGELTRYMPHLANLHGIDNNFVTIDMIEASSRLVPTLPEGVSARIHNKLHSLGVNIFLNRSVEKEDIDQILTKDMSMKSNTLIWTAGSKTNHFYGMIPGLNLHRNGRVIIDEYLHAEGFENVYIIGDAANTKYAGLAQTAIYDGTYMANVIASKSANKKLPVYIPQKVSYAVPVGRRWAAVSMGPLQIYGLLGYLIREIADLKFFLSILPWNKALAINRNQTIGESCKTCQESLAKANN